jgi:ribokinase
MAENERGVVLVAGTINTDLVARVPRAPEAGETVTGSTFAIFGGGKGANQAVSAARSGAAIVMLGAVGRDDFGRQRLADLEAEGIDVGSVGISERAASGVALITVEDATGQNRIAYVPGATLTVTPDAAIAAFARTRPAVVLMTLELPLAALDALTDAARSAGATVVLNATPEAIGAAPLLARVDWLVVNETEAGALLGHSVDDASGDDAARALARLGPRVVVVTLGAAGAVVFADGETTRIAAPPVAVVDTTGAGDAACGAIAARLAAGAGPIDAARAGVVAGSLACAAAGAQPSMPTRPAIDRVLGGP